MNTYDAAIDLRMMISDAIKEIGVGLQLAIQAAESETIGRIDRDSLESAADAFEEAAALLGDCEQLARKLAREEQ